MGDEALRENREIEKVSPNLEHAKFTLLATNNRLRYGDKNPSFGAAYEFAMMDLAGGKENTDREIAVSMREKVINRWSDPNEGVVNIMKLSRLESMSGMVDEAKDTFNQGLALLFQHYKNSSLNFGLAAGWVAVEAIRGGYQVELLQKCLEMENCNHKSNILYEIGDKFVAKGDIDNARKVFNEIEQFWRKVHLGTTIVSKLGEDGKIEEAKIVVQDCEAIISVPDSGVEKNDLFSQYLVVGQTEKTEEILNEYDHQLQKTDLSFRTWEETAIRYARSLIEAQRFKEARSVIRRLNNKITKVLSQDGDDDEFLGDKNIARMTRSTVVDLYCQLGDYAKVDKMIAAYGVIYSVDQLTKTAKQEVDKGNSQMGAYLAGKVMGEIMSLDQVDFWYFDDFFKPQAYWLATRTLIRYPDVSIKSVTKFPEMMFPDFVEIWPILPVIIFSLMVSKI